MMSSNALLLLILAVMALAWLIRRKHTSEKSRTGTADLEKISHQQSQKASGEELVIQPLADFNWEKTKPLKFRPFRPIYYITMALQSDTPSDLIIIDSNYLDRVTERRRIIAEHSPTVMGSIPEGHSAVQELYSYLLKRYLPVRYPGLFTISDDGQFFRNHITDLTVSSHAPEDPLTALRILGETVEDDMFLLHETPRGHLMVAFVCCFPSGFDPSSKLGKTLKDIHEPVPAYEKIGPSMERFFSRLEVGKSAKRINWTLTTQPELFNLKGNHIHAGEEIQEDVDIDIQTAHLRVEFQTLTRLPETRAVLFSFKSYLYPLNEIKEEGLGEIFADAIEGLKKGNAPDMWTYKGGIRWGKSVCEYLRS